MTKKFNLSKTIKKYPSPLLIGSVLIVAIAGSIALTMSRAATPFVSLEPEAGTRTGSAALVADTTASGGSAVRFGNNTAPSFTAVSPPAATANTAYSYTFTASGSPAPTFSVTAGGIPTGTTLSPSGVLSGTPTVPGTATFNITATNGVSPDAVVSRSIVIATGGGGGGIPAWRGDYQTGNFSQWSEQQLFRPAQQTIVTSPARAGFPRTARFEVNSGDMTSGDTGRNRSEVADYDSGHPANGQTMWWAWSMYLPAGFHLDSGQWMATTQWHTTSDTGGYGSGVALMLNAGVPRISYNATNNYWTDSQPLPLGQWNDFRVGILWRDNSSGHITIRMNGRTIVDANCQTLQPGQSTYFKQGVYRSASSQTHVLYYTGTRRGPTEASVAY